ncbi:hypothetical protein [Phenylobacterium sp.]|uniref:hypothetical protein n=1 Tax=Phenylobacterium sp. TaxID=1871053 RepID=UPI0025F479E6|nr:hypothetical protein [Phenylobacterium sp.]
MSLAAHKPLVAIHKNDLAWIIALYHAIHDGDPAPDISAAKAALAATSVIRGLAPYLDAGKHKAVMAALG